MAAKQTTRNIALTPHFDKFVRSKIESGRYQSASEVVRESLRMMECHERERQQALVDIREQIRVGYEQVQRGETIRPSEVFREINAMSRKARKASKRSK